MSNCNKIQVWFIRLKGKNILFIIKYLFFKKTIGFLFKSIINDNNYNNFDFVISLILIIPFWTISELISLILYLLLRPAATLTTAHTHILPQSCSFATKIHLHSSPSLDFSIPFWNSRTTSFVEHFINLCASWAVVADVWYLPPQRRADGETAIEFAARVRVWMALLIKGLDFSFFSFPSIYSLFHSLSFPLKFDIF